MNNSGLQGSVKLLLHNDPKMSKKESEKTREVYQAIAFEIDDRQPLFVLDSCFQDSFYCTASQAGLILLIGQVSDAFMSPLTGYLGDNVNVPVLSNKIGRRKSWHLVATVFMAISVPLFFNECFLCDGRVPSHLSLIYFGIFSALINICFNVLEINHLAFVATVAENVEEFTTLTAMRTMFGFLSGVYVYAIAWALLGQDNGVDLGPKNFSDLAYLSWIATGTGVFFATIFYIGRKELRKPLRKPSADMNFTPNISGKFMEVSRKTSLAHRLVNLLESPSTEKTHRELGIGNQDIEYRENRQRKRSILQKIVDIIFYDDENNPGDISSKIQQISVVTQNEVTKEQMFLEMQQLDRDRKKSVFMRVIDGLLFRSEQSQEELSTENIEGHSEVDSANGEYTGDNHWKEEGLHVVDKETDNSDSKRKVDTVEDGHNKRELKIDQVDKAASILTKLGKRRNGVVSITNDGKLGVPNFGFAFECERSKETEKNCLGDSSGLPQSKMSVTVSLSEPDVLSLMDREKGREFKIDESTEKPTTVAEENQGREGKGIVSVVNGNPSVSEDGHDMLGLPFSPTISLSKKRRPKSLKNWLRDPNLYKVAIVFTCSRLVQATAYTYLPLFLTESLQFTKEAIAYFPLVLLISASLSSMLCGKLNAKIGTKWSYLLAASLVMGGAAWSYFQTPFTKQTIYAPVVVIGGGMSIMYVMALAFMTELIGENKETSGSVISIITIIARLSSGGLVFGIQEFYPEKNTDSSGAIGSYVQHVFAMAPGILTLVGFLLVLFYQPSVLASKNKEPLNDIEAQADKDDSLLDDVVSQFSPKCTGTASVSPDENQNTSMAMIHSCSEDTKL